VCTVVGAVTIMAVTSTTTTFTFTTFPHRLTLSAAFLVLLQEEVASAM
jgi:hypothetical protein